MAIERQIVVDLDTEEICHYFKDDNRSDYSYKGKTYPDTTKVKIRKDFVVPGINPLPYKAYLFVVERARLTSLKTGKYVGDVKLLSVKIIGCEVTVVANLLIRDSLDNAKRKAIEGAFEKYSYGDDIGSIESALFSQGVSNSDFFVTFGFNLKKTGDIDWNTDHKDFFYDAEEYRIDIVSTETTCKDPGFNFKDSRVSNRSKTDDEIINDARKELPKACDKLDLFRVDLGGINIPEYRLVQRKREFISLGVVIKTDRYPVGQTRNIRHNFEGHIVFPKDPQDLVRRIIESALTKTFIESIVIAIITEGRIDIAISYFKWALMKEITDSISKQVAACIYVDIDDWIIKGDWRDL
ncbi:TPA: hypothetical protein ACPJ06_003762 [Vibrio diabolicus]